MKLAVLFSALCALWAMVLFCHAEEDSLEKRYMAALAKNNRLPKLGYIHKKSEESDDESSDDESSDDETDGLFLHRVVRPEDIFEENDSDISSFLDPSQDDFLESSPLSEARTLSDQAMGKRNVAALARLGRLNTIRYGRFQPHYVSGKRVYNEDDNEEDNQEITNNEIDGDDIECETDNEDAIDELAEEINGRQKKRYVAALARSGRLPIWHSQRMWSGKRDFAYPVYQRINSRMDMENNLDNFIDEVPTYAMKQKKCRKTNQHKRQKRDVEIDGIPFESINLSGLQNEIEKRNLAALARNGKLPSRYFGNNKRDSDQDESDEEEFLADNKRNIASLARNGKLFNSRGEGKRNIAALAKNGKQPHFMYEGKRNIAALARNGKLLGSSVTDGKRNVAALARNGKFPSFGENKGKRNLAALAKNGKLPTIYENEGKRNLAALARNGKLPSFYNGNDKRNIQALARNNKLPAFTSDKRDSMELDEQEKRNLAALAKNGKLASFIRLEGKRNLAALAKNGKLPSFGNVDDKRNVAALARNGKLPTFGSEDKRNLAALARDGKLPMFDSREDKRNMAALAKNGKLPSFYPSEGKRNIAALARNGKFPSFETIDEKREMIPVSGIFDEVNKRNIAALARKGQLTHFTTQGKKRNIALGKNGKLHGFNRKEDFTTSPFNPIEKWNDVFQDDIEE